MPSVAIVGGGFGGVGAAALLRRAGDLTLFERGERLGGVWQANTYPGAACDIPSHLYEYSFAPNPRWSRRYAPQAEIQAYVEDVARRGGVDARTPPRCRSARWDGARWVLETSAGSTSPTSWSPRAGSSRCRSIPPLPGLDNFAAPRSTPRAGATTSPLAGKRVAVIGTGCSAVQVVPAIRRRSRTSTCTSVRRLDDPEARLRVLAARAGTVRALPCAAAPRPRLELRLPRVLRPTA